MAKIWYVQEGDMPTNGEPRCELPFEKFKELFKLADMEYRGTKLTKFPSSKPALDGYRAEEFVVLEVAGEELADYPQMKEGFHLLINFDSDQCEEILKGN